MWPKVKTEKCLYKVCLYQSLDDLDTNRQELKETIINMFKDFKELML